jgi:hypothetical protein
VSDRSLLVQQPSQGAAPAEPAEPVRRRDHRLAGWAVLAGLLALGLAAIGRLEPLAAQGLAADAGIQFHLAAETARGAVPVRDFEHGWNVLSWYYLAFFYVVSFGQASLWAFLWGTVAGPLLAGAVLLVLARRHGLPATWILGLTAAILVVSDVPNGKYALPALWLFALRPEGRLGAGRAALLGRFLLAGVVVLSHIELALMLCLGTALYDVLGARGLSLGMRAARVAALAAGGLVFFAGQIAVYARLGVSPGDLISFLIIDRAGVSSAATAYDGSLLQPENLLGAVFPATLVVAFVPALWRRLSDTTRLTAALHLALGLIAIRKPDEGHLGAATTLLAVLAVLVLWDLTRSRDALPLPRPTARALVGVALGAAWLVGTVLAGFSAGSIAALPLLLGLTALGAVAALRGALPAASTGALMAAVGLTVISTASMALADVRGPRDELQERVMAASLAGDVERCLGGGDRAWIVPDPLRLYAALELENPTPYYLFWAGFVDDSPEVLERIEDGEVPAVIQIGPWPPSMSVVAPVIERDYALCGEVLTPAVPDEGVVAQSVRIWVQP